MDAATFAIIPTMKAAGVEVDIVEDGPDVTLRAFDAGDAYIVNEGRVQPRV